MANSQYHAVRKRMQSPPTIPPAADRQNSQTPRSVRPDVQVLLTRPKASPSLVVALDFGSTVCFVFSCPDCSDCSDPFAPSSLEPVSVHRSRQIAQKHWVKEIRAITAVSLLQCSHGFSSWTSIY